MGMEDKSLKTLAIISQKGGAGKTTLALNLAVAAESIGVPTVVIDLDPQASAKTWHDIRVRKDAPFVVSAQAIRLDEVIEVSRANGAELVMIDTAPHSESAALGAARAADLVLIPCRPAGGAGRWWCVPWVSLYSRQLEDDREHQERHCSGEQRILACEGLLVGKCFRREVLE